MTLDRVLVENKKREEVSVDDKFVDADGDDMTGPLRIADADGDPLSIEKDGELQFKTRADGTTQACAIQLGDKFRLSGVGDSHADDDWLRLQNVQDDNYHGGLAANRLYAQQDLYARGQLLLHSDIERIKGELRAGHHTVAVRGEYGELEIKGSRIDWTEHDLYVGWENDPAGSIILGANGSPVEIRSVLRGAIQTSLSSAPLTPLFGIAMPAELEWEPASSDPKDGIRALITTDRPFNAYTYFAAPQFFSDIMPTVLHSVADAMGDYFYMRLRGIEGLDANPTWADDNVRWIEWLGIGV